MGSFGSDEASQASEGGFLKQSAPARLWKLRAGWAVRAQEKIISLAKR